MTSALKLEDQKQILKPKEKKKVERIPTRMEKYNLYVGFLFHNYLEEKRYT